MTAFSKTTPVGIDAYIHRFLTSMERELPNEWGVNTSVCRFFGRADEWKEEKFTWSKGKESVDLGYNDKFCFTSYFVVRYPTSQSGFLNIADVSLYCHGKIGSLYDSITTYTADVELIESVKALVDRRLDYLSTVDIIKVAYPEVSFKLNFEEKYHA